MFLYVTSLSDDAPIVTIARAIAEQQAKFNGEPLRGLAVLTRVIYDELRSTDGPWLVGQSDDHALVDQAGAALESLGAQIAVTDTPWAEEELSEPQDEPAEPDAEDDFDGLKIAQTALAFMAFSDGSASVAVSYLATMAHIDPDGPFADAVDLLLNTFPANAQHLKIAEMILANAEAQAAAAEGDEA